MYRWLKASTEWQEQSMCSLRRYFPSPPATGEEMQQVPQGEVETQTHLAAGRGYARAATKQRAEHQTFTQTQRLQPCQPPPSLQQTCPAS